MRCGAALQGIAPFLHGAACPGSFFTVGWLVGQQAADREDNRRSGVGGMVAYLGDQVCQLVQRLCGHSLR